MMTKWDTIQEDVKDQYAYLEDEVVEDDEDDIWGHEVINEIELDEEYN